MRINKKILLYVLRCFVLSIHLFFFCRSLCRPQLLFPSFNFFSAFPSFWLFPSTQVTFDVEYLEEYFIQRFRGQLFPFVWKIVLTRIFPTGKIYRNIWGCSRIFPECELIQIHHIPFSLCFNHSLPRPFSFTFNLHIHYSYPS